MNIMSENIMSENMNQLLSRLCFLQTFLIGQYLIESRYSPTNRQCSVNHLQNMEKPHRDIKRYIIFFIFPNLKHLKFKKIIQIMNYWGVFGVFKILCYVTLFAMIGLEIPGFLTEIKHLTCFLSYGLFCFLNYRVSKLTKFIQIIKLNLLILLSQFFFLGF